jgi:hypothetical protein
MAFHMRRPFAVCRAGMTRGIWTDTLVEVDVSRCQRLRDRHADRQRTEHEVGREATQPATNLFRMERSPK